MSMRTIFLSLFLLSSLFATSSVYAVPKPLHKPLLVPVEAQLPERKPQIFHIFPKYAFRAKRLPAALQSHWQRYLQYRDIKAFAIYNKGNKPKVAGVSVANTRLEEALDDALESCRKTVRALEIKPDGSGQDCQIFALGDYILDQSPLGQQNRIMALMRGLEGNSQVGRARNGSLMRK